MTANTFFIKQLSSANKNLDIRIIWLHGWGLNHQSLLPLANFFTDIAENYLIDLPGFGVSAPPDTPWSSIDYAKVIGGWLQTLEKKTTYIIGHSFGCRVGMQLASLYPEQIQNLILIAAPGVKRKRSLFFKVKAFTLKHTSKVLKFVDRCLKTSFKENFANHVGSKDYINAKGIMRSILVKAVNENLAGVASTISQPTLLIYGKKDNETPPELGEKFKKLIKQSTLIILSNMDHHSILTTGRYQVQNIIEKSLLNPITERE